MLSFILGSLPALIFVGLILLIINSSSNDSSNDRSNDEEQEREAKERDAKFNALMNRDSN